MVIAAGSTGRPPLQVHFITVDELSLTVMHDPRLNIFFFLILFSFFVDKTDQEKGRQGWHSLPEWELRLWELPAPSWRLKVFLAGRVRQLQAFRDGASLPDKAGQDEEAQP